MHADGGDEPDALLVAEPHLGPEHAGRDHPDVPRWIEPVERERVAAGDDREPVVGTPQRQRRDDVIGHQHAHDVGRGRVGDLARGEAVGDRLVTRRVGAHAHGHVET